MDKPGDYKAQGMILPSQGMIDNSELAKLSCPFADRAFSLPIDTPCPVCGAKGNSMEPFEKCVG